MIGNENTNKASFLAETETEESLMLMGRVNALEAMVNYMPEVINAEVVSAVLGFADHESDALKSANESAEQYRRWYYDEASRNAELSKKNQELQMEIFELKGKEEENKDGNTV